MLCSAAGQNKKNGNTTWKPDFFSKKKLSSRIIL